MCYLIIFIVSEVSVLFSDKMESLFSSQKFDFLSDIFMKKNWRRLSRRFFCSDRLSTLLKQILKEQFILVSVGGDSVAITLWFL